MRQDWIGQAVQRGPWESQRQAIILAILALFVALIIGALYLSQVADTSTTGRQLEVLLLERDRLEQTNEQLRVEIAELRSVPRLLSEAEQLGFQPATRERIEYLIVEGYNPARSRTVAPIREETDQDTLPAYDETFTGWLRQQVDDLRGQFEDFNSLAE